MSAKAYKILQVLVTRVSSEWILSQVERVSKQDKGALEVGLLKKKTHTRSEAEAH